jgi:hypothetical protein
MTRRGRFASEQLTGRLVVLERQGERPRCSDPMTNVMWTAENADDRAIAAQWCNGCSVLTLCGEAAEERGEK